MVAPFTDYLQECFRMRMKLLTALLMAGTVVGCASNPPPPPPPMADATPPTPPPPASVGAVDGMYRGMADLADGSGPRCAKMTRTQTVRVRNNAFSLMGVRATIAPDGSVTSASRRGTSVTGTASGTGLDLTTMHGKCNYHYSLTKA